MKCTVSSSNKLITCRIPTAPGTCTTGSWCHAWAAPFCPVERSYATSSSILEGTSPLHLQPLSFLSAYLPLPVVVTCLTLFLCKHLPVVLQPPTFMHCSCYQLFCCMQTPLLPPICSVESQATQMEYRETVLKVNLRLMTYCLLMSI